MKKKVTPPNENWIKNHAFLLEFVPRPDAGTFLSKRRGGEEKAKNLLLAYSWHLPKSTYRRIRTTVLDLREGKPVNEKQTRNLAIKQWAKMDKKFRSAS